MGQTIYWYDLETFGRNPGWDRIAQFAGIRTDENFQILEEPLVLYCRIPPDYLPDPRSCLITGITPQKTLEEGLWEYEFLKRIDQEFSRPGTCVAGYNSIRFDDEFIRNLYYRNFRDPYLREYSAGNSRWDLIELVRAAHDLRPEGMEWPRAGEEDRPSFRLEDLTAANGIGHAGAHDALADVKATIALAEKLYRAQPKLFRYAFRIRKKEEIRRQVDLFAREPFIHTSGMYTSSRGCTTLVCPLTVDPSNRNCLLCYDLREDPTPLLELPVEEIRERIFTPRDRLAPGKNRIPITGIHLNQAPFVAPLSTMEPDRAAALGIDWELCLARGKLLAKAGELTQKILKVYQGDPPAGSPDPDLQIYSGGFFPDEDRDGFREIHGLMETGETGRLKEMNLSFRDPRIPEMLRRFRGRNLPETLDRAETAKWKSYCAGRILFPPAEDALDMGKYRKVIATLRESRSLAPAQKVTLKALEEYGDTLQSEVLDYHE